jgi:hypothetical protein
MLIAGVLGGAINYFLAQERNAEANKINLVQSIIIGIGASLLVPLFLNMISSSLLSEVVGNQEKPGDFSKALVFLGFCLVAAVSSRAFIQTISDRILNEVKKTADEAKKEVEEVHTKLGEVEDLVVEPEQHVAPDAKKAALAPKVTLTADERKILVALANGRWLLRSRIGVANDARINPDQIDSLLSALEARQLVGQKKSTGGPRWYITQVGNEAINQHGGG